MEPKPTPFQTDGASAHVFLFPKTCKEFEGNFIGVFIQKDMNNVLHRNFTRTLLLFKWRAGRNHVPSLFLSHSRHRLYGRVSVTFMGRFAGHFLQWD